MRFAICLLTSWLLLVGAVGARPPIESLEALLASLSKLQGVTASYTEEKRIAILKRPLKSSGQIHFAAPNLLLRKTARPEPSAVLVKGDKLSVADASGTRSIDLGQNQIVRHLVQSFVYVLSGNSEALQRLYHLGFSRRPDGWKLSLTPKQQALGKLISNMTFLGSGVVVEQMVLREATGDETRMVFQDVDVGVYFDAAARARIFVLPSD